MENYLLTWNPDRWNWDMKKDKKALMKRGYFDGSWSCRTSQIQPGDQVYLVKQGKQPRGIFASGVAITGRYEDHHWDAGSANSLAQYVKVRFDVLLNPFEEPFLLIDSFPEGPLKMVHWSTQGSGIRIDPTAAVELQALWRKFLDSTDSTFVDPTEVAPGETFAEGASRPAFVNRYERSRKARQACIDHHGSTCKICDFNFAEVYGEELGRGVIQVHHLRELSTIGKQYRVDPKEDLVPVSTSCCTPRNQCSPQRNCVMFWFSKRSRV